MFVEPPPQADIHHHSPKFIHVSQQVHSKPPSIHHVHSPAPQPPPHVVVHDSPPPPHAIVHQPPPPPVIPHEPPNVIVHEVHHEPQPPHVIVHDSPLPPPVHDSPLPPPIMGLEPRHHDRVVHTPQLSHGIMHESHSQIVHDQQPPAVQQSPGSVLSSIPFISPTDGSFGKYLITLLIKSRHQHYISSK